MANVNGFNVRFERYNDHVHLYEVEGLHDHLLKYKDVCLKSFYDQREKIEAEHDSYNTPLLHPEFYHEFDPLLYGLIDHYYLVGEMWETKTIGVYVQTPEHFRDIRHNHANSGVITTTFYIDPIEDESQGGGLEFDLGDRHDKFTLYPKKDIIYMFPGWAIHRPLPQTRKQERICLNWGYDCNIRPIHKYTADRW